ncbi:hypothetical protein H6G76_30895 [Nostoc sp. FACHB-152]|uniref:hypothetical protein n=1 Tax=Nostoc sp. FACHB-152 TaxID=2692837 RepID=UPI0016892111|nr:hypothetical protein [Nostoc sp. FACHB-152]MBD2451453.1 hypothetical protein [Nostoc sp. FACHB-152]
MTKFFLLAIYLTKFTQIVAFFRQLAQLSLNRTSNSQYGFLSKSTDVDVQHQRF